MKKWLNRLGIGLLVILVILIVATSLIGGFLIKNSINVAGPRLLGVPMHIEGATLNPILGHIALKGLHIGNPEGFKTQSLFDMARLDIRLRTRSLFTGKIVIESIAIANPEITYESSLKTSNIDQLMKTLSPDKTTAEKNEPAKKETPGKKVIIKELVVDGIRVHVAFTALGGQGFTLPLPPIHLSNVGDKEGGATFSEAVKEILGAIFQGVNDAVTDSGRLLGSGAAAAGEGVGKAATAITEGADKAIEGVKNLLK